MERKVHSWTPHEDELLVGCLKEIVVEGGLDFENISKPFLYKTIENMINDGSNGSVIKANDICMRMKTMKNDWLTIYDMIHIQENPGFQWDSEKNCIVAEDNVWTDYINVSHCK